MLLLLAEGKENADVRLVYLMATILILLGFLFALNFKGMSEKFFYFVTRYTPKGNATPNTVRIIGGGWVVVGVFMFLPEIVSVFR
ncbi:MULTISPECIES: hypothetical protein [unclassified Streptomyces]|uniref:hypothetical protein n=1 Tax=unclassified Streptomyces TaxID=2593676 RepID=UPI0038299E0E